MSERRKLIGRRCRKCGCFFDMTAREIKIHAENCLPGEPGKNKVLTFEEAVKISSSRDQTERGTN